MLFAVHIRFGMVSKKLSEFRHWRQVGFSATTRRLRSAANHRSLRVPLLPSQGFQRSITLTFEPQCHAEMVMRRSIRGRESNRFAEEGNSLCAPLQGREQKAAFVFEC